MWDRDDGLGHGLLQRPGPATRLVGAAGLAGCWAWASCAVRVLASSCGWQARQRWPPAARWCVARRAGILEYYMYLFSRVGRSYVVRARDFCPRGVVVKRSAVRASARARERASLRVLGFSGSRLLGFSASWTPRAAGAAGAARRRGGRACCFYISASDVAPGACRVAASRAFFQS